MNLKQKKAFLRNKRKCSKPLTLPIRQKLSRFDILEMMGIDGKSSDYAIRTNYYADYLFNGKSVSSLNIVAEYKDLTKPVILAGTITLDYRDFAKLTKTNPNEYYYKVEFELTRDNLPYNVMTIVAIQRY